MEKQFFAQTSVRGRLREIRIADVTVHDIPVNLQQGTSGAYASASFSGTIGQRVLSRFTNTYDYGRSRILLAPNAGSEKPFPPRTTFGLSLLADGADFTTFTVNTVRKGSAADEAGFRKGDVLAVVDGRPASAWRLTAVQAALREDGTAHTVEVRRGEETVQLAFTVKVVSIEDL